MAKAIERIEVDAKSRIETDIDYDKAGKQVGWLVVREERAREPI
jgi:hypothetical protein